MIVTRRMTVIALGASAFGGKATAATPIRVAVIGEQIVHSLHRENDPEYPQLLAEILNDDAKVEPTPHPTGGGFLYGGGARYRIGNFGHPRGTVIDHALDNPKSVLRSEELKLAGSFMPDIVIIGPFGDHEPLTKQSMDRFAPDLGRLVSRIGNFKSRPKIYLALPIPRGPTDEDGNYRRVRDDTNAVARERGLPTIDLWSAFLGRPQFYQDMTHLTVAGRRHLAQTVARAIR